jgi:hypothetical protein
MVGVSWTCELDHVELWIVGAQVRGGKRRAREAYLLELDRNVQNNQLSGSLPIDLSNLANLQTL